MKVFRAISATTAADVDDVALCLSHLLTNANRVLRKCAATHTRKCIFAFAKSAPWMIRFLSLSLLVLLCILVFSRPLAGPQGFSG